MKKKYMTLLVPKTFRAIISNSNYTCNISIY